MEEASFGDTPARDIDQAPCRGHRNHGSLQEDPSASFLNPKLYGLSCNSSRCRAVHRHRIDAVEGAELEEVFAEVKLEEVGIGSALEEAEIDGELDEVGMGMLRS